MNTHARLSPSAAERWIACPPSVALCEQIPETTSPYAEEGTVAHKLAETVISKALGRNSSDEAAKAMEQITASKYYTPDMRENLEPYTDYIISHALGADFVGLEERLSMDDWIPDCYGTSDAILVRDDTLEVIDLKYGRGVRVEAEGNPQFRLYALGALQEWRMFYPFSRIRCTVVQPRLDNVSSEDLTADELITWAENVVKPAALLAAEGQGEYRSGEHCRWCRAKAICRKRAEDNLALARYEFAAPPLIQHDDIPAILETAGRLKAWIGDIEAYALNSAVNHGATYDGFKLVEGRRTRRLTNADAAVAALMAEGVSEGDLYKYELISIPAMEKLVGKDRMGELITWEPGKPTLVRVTDKRPALNSAEAAAADFAD